MFRRDVRQALEVEKLVQKWIDEQSLAADAELLRGDHAEAKRHLDQARDIESQLESGGHNIRKLVCP